MKIKDILQEDDRFPIVSIDRCKITKVGEIKTSKPGEPFQCITIQDGEYKVPVFLYSTELRDMGIAVGQYISFQSGPPVGGKPTGLIVRKSDDGKVRVNATDKCIVTIDDAAPMAKPQLTESAAPHQAVAKKPTQPTIMEEDSTDVPEGPSDHVIRECFAERLHVLRILEQCNQESFNAFSQESLYPMVTSIIIDASRAGKKILPIVERPKKPKFGTIDKQHNPEKVKEHPTDKEDVAQDEMTNAELIVKFCDDNEDFLKCLKFKTPKGSTIKQVMSKQGTRSDAMQWMLAKKAKGGDEDSQMYVALNELFTELPNHLKMYAVYESVFFNQVGLGHIDPPDNAGADVSNLNEDHMASIIEKFKGDATMKDLWKFFKNYYKAPVDNRKV